MKLRKVVAVAALAVVGVVGMASAQGTPSIGETIRDGNKLTGDKSVETVKMNVTHTIELKAEMVGTGRGVEGGVALADIVLDAGDTEIPVPTTIADIVKFGLLTVNTNYPAWDIGLTTRGGGRLSTDGELITPDPICDNPDTSWNFPNPNPIITPGPCTTADPYYGVGSVLTTANGDEVKLMVAIGVVDLSTTTPTAEAHTAIDDVDLQASKQGAAEVPISFVEQLAITANAGTTVGGRDLDPTATGPTAAVELGFGLTPPNGEWFYISVGVLEEDFAALGGNPEGEYYETLTFTMYANY